MSESTFLSKLASHIQSHYDLTKQELTVVFPNKRAAFYLRNAFRENCDHTIWLPQMISIEEAVTQWSGITLADNIDLLFELIDIDAELHVEQDSDLSVFGSQAAQMIKDFDEIDGISTKRKARKRKSNTLNSSSHFTIITLDFAIGLPSKEKAITA